MLIVTFLFLSLSSFSYGHDLYKRHPQLKFLKRDYNNAFKKNPNMTRKQVSEIVLKSFVGHQNVRFWLKNDLENLKVYFGYKNNNWAKELIRNLERKIENSTFTVFDYELVSKLSIHSDQIGMILHDIKKREASEKIVKIRGAVFLRNQQYIDLIEVLKNSEYIKRRVFKESSLTGFYEFLKDKDAVEPFEIPLDDTLLSSVLVELKKDDYWVFRKNYLPTWYTVQNLSHKDLIEMTLEGFIVRRRALLLRKLEGIGSYKSTTLDKERSFRQISPGGNFFAHGENLSKKRTLLLSKLSVFQKLYNEKVILDGPSAKPLYQLSIEIFWFYFVYFNEQGFDSIYKSDLFFNIFKNDPSLGSYKKWMRKFLLKKAIVLSKKEERVVLSRLEYYFEVIEKALGAKASCRYRLL